MKNIDRQNHDLAEREKVPGAREVEDDELRLNTLRRGDPPLHAEHRPTVRQLHTISTL